MAFFTEKIRLTKVYHDGTLSGDGTPTSLLSVLSVGAAIMEPVGAVNGSNKIFTFARAPTAIAIDHGNWILQTSQDGTVNWTGTTTITLSNYAPQAEIFGI